MSDDQAPQQVSENGVSVAQEKLEEGYKVWYFGRRFPPLLTCCYRSLLAISPTPLPMKG